MRHVKQREDWDCGIAVAAMLTPTSYRRAREAAGLLPVDDGLTTVGLFNLLHYLTGDVWFLERECRVPLARMDFNDACAVSIGWGKEPEHWIAFAGGLVYDPDCNAPLHVRHVRYRHARAFEVLAREEDGEVSCLGLA